MDYKTRTERLNHVKRQKHRKTKQITASVFGTAILAVPVSGALAPIESQAQETSQAASESLVTQGFINEIAPVASSIGAANDLYASVMIAQALLESNSGTSTLATAPNYNLFGIKDYSSAYAVSYPTYEYLDGAWTVMNEPFKVYSSYWESFQDYANTLISTNFNGSYHYASVWKSNTTSYLDATAALTGRYATDPTYGQKLNWLIQAYGLTAYDTPSYGAPQVETVTYGYEEEVYETEAATTVGQSYTVANGDTLWDIAQKFGISVEQLQALNGISNEHILIGDVLAVS